MKITIRRLIETKRLVSVFDTLIKVHKTDSIGHVKLKYYAQTMMPPSLQNFIYNGRYVSEHETLYSIGCGKHSIIYVTEELPKNNMSEILVYVKFLGGPTVNIFTSVYDTTRNLKEKLWSLTNYLPNQIQLSYCTKSMWDECELHKYHIGYGSKIDAIVR